MEKSHDYTRISYLIPIILIFLGGIFLQSCKVYTPSYVFQHIDRDTTIAVQSYENGREEWKIRNSDQLLIRVSSLSPEEDRIFNAAEGFATDKAGSYTVSKEGNIFFHKLGSFRVLGLTLMALKEKLEQDLQPYLKDPIVTVGFANHYVTVMGEVGNPRKINLNNEQFTLLDVLAETGKSTADVNMNNLMVIREKSGSRNFKTLNLEDPSVFNSEYYLMQPGDIVVVKPNEKKMMTEEKRMRAQQITTLSLQVVTIGLIIYQTFFRK
jgi:polysaccharide export outer membrane protein